MFEHTLQMLHLETKETTRRSSQTNQSQTLGTQAERYSFNTQTTKVEQKRCSLEKIPAYLARREHTTEITILLPSPAVNLSEYDALRHLTLGDPYFSQPADFLPFIDLDSVLRNLSRSLEARESHLVGTCLAQTPRNYGFSVTVSTSDEFLVHEQIKKFWQLEKLQRLKEMGFPSSFTRLPLLVTRPVVT